MNAHSHTWTEPRLDTPPFELTEANLARLAEVIAMCAKWGADPAASIDLELEHLIRAHLYAHRPIVGIFRSLDGIGFGEDFDANRAEHMAEAYAEWARVTAPVLEKAA